MLVSPRELIRHARALTEVLGTTDLRRLIHGPGSLRAGTAEGDQAIEGLISYAAEVDATHVVYHAANLPDEPASEDARLAETRSLAALASTAERLGVIVALENLAPVFAEPDKLSFTPLILRTMAKRISSPAVGLCLDIGHANVVANIRGTDPLELIEPALDRVVLFHLHDNLGARRDDPGSPELDPLRLDLHLPPGRGTVPWDRLAADLRPQGGTVDARGAPTSALRSAPARCRGQRGCAAAGPGRDLATSQRASPAPGRGRRRPERPCRW